MRVALSAAALALTPVAGTIRLQERLNRKSGGSLFARNADAAAATTQSSIRSDPSKPLWKQADRGIAAAGAGFKSCNPSKAVTVTSEDEPDVGILAPDAAAACPPGYTCQPIQEQVELGVAAGTCVLAYEDTSLLRNLQGDTGDDGLCGFYDYLGFTCDCSNWSGNGVGNFSCSIAYGNATYFGLPVAIDWNLNVTNPQDADLLQIEFQTCYTVLDESLAQADVVQNYCTTRFQNFDVSTNSDTNSTLELSSESCNVTFNDQACSSCTISNCTLQNATLASVDSFDCSNIESSVVVDGICEGNSVWKTLLAADYPTAEPTISATFEPSVGSPTPAPASNGGSSPIPTASGGGSSKEPTLTSGGTGNPPSSDNASEGWTTSFVWINMATVIATGMLGLGAALI
ncbi:hypothetical protein MPSEU_000976100 [Mayamaea pseudoterrestris]|nr:hypothetical protein MPSEU_000976100 [Mayamaea pseudoterrestris]